MVYVAYQSPLKEEKVLGNTLLEGVFIRLTWQRRKVMKMKKVLCMFVTLSYEIFNAHMTLFEMSLSW